MSKICEITGKRVIRGNNVSHSRVHTKRTFSPNLHTKKFYIPEEDMWITLKVSAKGMRIETLANELAKRHNPNWDKARRIKKSQE